MSDEGDKTCPLCAEEMDLTDQQLRPCKCGYDICVWCWHNIMGMAEKDDTKGRCPACRTPYNKEKIVETSSKCERLVAEMSVEKKQKSQKGKAKTFEARKQLSSVRVIQRNLVYIVGLPLNLADEDLLQRKDYFGQYGKVLKVSISRTAAGTVQHFANNTCSVYITYSKEDEAVRSIQSVHGFVLDGRPLRACFGTTKYCHAWLRSMPCTNPDCLYLHEFGSQEDSFTKDETISGYTRGRVQQITGATNETQRRSGNILPPAADDYSNNNTSSLGKPIDKSTTNDPPNSMKGSPPNSSSGRSLALPAAASWILTEPLASNKADNPTMDDSYVDEVEAELVSFNNQRLWDPEVVTHTHTGYVHNNHSLPFRNTFNTTAVSNGDHKTALDLGENSIISNILSMDFDLWDESLTSPQNLAKLLSNGDKRGSQRVSDSRKAHNCNQSRFSFAREDDGCTDQGLGGCQNGFKSRCDFVGNTDVYQGPLGDGTGFSSFCYEKSDRTAASYSALSSNKISVSRSQIYAPPGFMGPSRAPPPGFTSNENLSGNHMFDSSSSLRKVNQAPAAVYNNGGIGELEFTDTAILAVGGRVPLSGLTSQGLDMRSNVSCLENDNRLRLLVQRSFTQQNQRTDPYGVSTRIVDHNNRSAYQQVASFQQGKDA